MVQIASQRGKVNLTVLSLSAALLFGGCAASDAISDDESVVDVLAQEEVADDADAGAPATPDDAQPRWAQREDLGKGDGRDVVMIGDSWMAGALNFGGIADAIKSIGNVRYRDYSVTATQLSTGAIPRQFTQAVRANKDIKTVIMTGGGNDVLIGGADPAKAGALIVNELNKLWTTMSEAGVKDVVYIQYASSAGTARSRGAIDDNAAPPPIPICQKGPIICHSVPTSDIVTRRELGVDGIHPNSSGNSKIAKRVLELLEARKIRR
jgi:hypothetical protein